MSPEATIDKYKAIILMRIFNQKKGVDYFDIYSLVTKIMTVRSFITCQHSLLKTLEETSTPSSNPLGGKHNSPTES